MPDFNEWLETHAGWPSASSPARDLGEAWTTLFIEHRRWKFSGPFDLQGEELDRLDRLALEVRRLIESEC